ncbi:hypothetical protein SUDANB180_04206 [Streptomyces sp. enrichment culture]
MTGDVLPGAGAASPTPLAGKGVGGCPGHARVRHTLRTAGTLRPLSEVCPVGKVVGITADQPRSLLDGPGFLPGDDQERTAGFLASHRWRTSS